MQTRFSFGRKLVLGLSVSLGAFYAPALAAQVVGEVTTIIGKAAVIRADTPDVRDSVTKGLPIQVGDKLETAAGGHVHIRFVDGGLVSVRPLSRLHIQNYAHAQKGKKDSVPATIHFNLEQGVVRSVTGAWGEANRDRFRLHTPVVAIGIKGTDFVVQTEPQKSSAHVVTGAIVMTPLSDCPAGHACKPDDGVLLSAAMGGQTLAFDSTRGINTPQMVAAATPAQNQGQNVAILASAQIQEATKLASAESHVKEAFSSSAPSFDNISNNSKFDNIPDNSQDSLTPSVEIAADKPMRWIRNPLGWGIPANSIAVHRASLAEQMDGMQAIAGNFVTTLYRDEQTHPHYLGSQGKASFALKEGSAAYSRPGLFGQAVAIHQPRLDVDFQAGTFATRLDLSGEFGTTRFESEGRISPEGILKPTAAPDQNLAGALSHDARQAGYLFQKRAADGQVSGLTLWGR